MVCIVFRGWVVVIHGLRNGAGAGGKLEKYTVMRNRQSDLRVSLVLSRAGQSAGVQCKHAKGPASVRRPLSSLRPRLHPTRPKTQSKCRDISAFVRICRLAYQTRLVAFGSQDTSSRFGTNPTPVVRRKRNPSACSVQSNGA